MSENARRRTLGQAYAIATATLVLAVVLRKLIDPFIGDTLPLVTLFGAVAVAAWAAGSVPALGVTILGYIACAYLFVAPRGALGLDSTVNLVGLAAYLVTCTLIIAAGAAMRRAQGSASDQREVLRVTLRSIGDAVITTDVAGRVTYMNAVAESLTGWLQAEALGERLDSVFRTIDEGTRLPVDNPVVRALREGVPVDRATHTVLLRKDGIERPIDNRAAPIKDEHDHVSGCVLIFRDISGQRLAEQERAGRLLDARLLAAIVESSDDAIVSKSLDGIIQSWNASAERLFGYTAAEAVGRHISLVIPAERMAEEDHIVASLKAGLRIEHFETERLHRDGQHILVSLTISPIRNDAGQVIGASKIARDITRQRRAEERERNLLADAASANAKFHAFFEQGALFAGIMHVDGTLLEANRLSCEGCGFAREHAVGRPFWEGPWWAPSPVLVERIKAGAALAAAGQTFQIETPYFVGDGSQRLVDVTILPIRDEDGHVRFLAPTGTDITERKRVEAESEKLVTLVENSTDFIGICDLNGVPSFINRAGLALVGLDSIEDARQTSISEFFFPDDRPKMMGEFFQSVLADGHGEIDVRFRNFKTGAARWMAYKVVTLKDAVGAPIAFATVSQDMTERRRLEDNLRALAADLSDAARRKDEFLAMLAHELRNPLAPLSNAAQVLQRAGDNPESVRLASQMLERHVGQLTRLVDDLLDVSRITRGKIELRKERVELAPVIGHVVEATRALYKTLNHELTVTMPSQPVYLDGDPTRLAQIVGNLLNNAYKFTDSGGQIWLTTEREGDQAVIRVRDNGIGIAADQLPRLFEMFTQVDASLERSRDGLGIGLTLVKTLVEMHQGTIEARSEGLGLGSEFVVRLPLVAAIAKPARKATVSQPAATTRRRVLIVDDNEDGAESLSLLLKFGGHEPHMAYDGLQAFDAAEQLRPDAVLLDIGLPKMNGYDVCRRIREQTWGQGLLLVALTGLGQEDDRHRSGEAGFDAHMVKPVDYDALMRLLASLHPDESLN